MDFRTVADIPALGLTLTHRTSGLLLGSCFADAIGERMEAGKLPVCRNPLGVLYNPLSIASTLRRIAAPVFFTAEDLFQRDGLYGTFDAHSSLSDPDPDRTLEKLNEAVKAAHTVWKEAGYLILTLGTARVYRRKDTGRTVCNCHKFPAADFDHVLLSPEAVVRAFTDLAAELPELARKQVLLTVSPVRHLKDGFAGNQLSKATLTVAAHRLCETFPGFRYFPAYEILMDELRDYRFYASDMVHPSGTAIDYIWERFSQNVFDAPTRNLLARIERIRRAAAHAPLRPDTEAYRVFCRKTLAEAEDLARTHPYLDFSEEKKRFSLQNIPCVR